MVDHLTPEQRHVVMSKIRSKDTLPERVVRKTVHGLGFRFRLHRKDLPGKPDLVFPRMKKVIFVNGCFWHGHKCKSTPKSNVEFWEEKLRRNVTRDKKKLRDLRKLGWTPLVVWECRTRNLEKLEAILSHFLER
ncbi:MAG: very short patch repair endonuclease [Thermodesulfovibrio sp.]|nr:very short patch repair endonuclease [Thermodesulfovibrio sp.]